MKTRTIVPCFALVLSCLTMQTSMAAEPSETPAPVEGMHCHSVPAETTAAVVEPTPPAANGAFFTSGPLRIPDTALTDEDGKQVHFYRDVVAGKVVAINFIFTSCTTICPPMGANFGKLQKLLAANAGRPVELVSISIDPTTDTPARLKAWRSQFGSEAGWTLLTGSKPRVDALLRSLGVASSSANDHTPILLVGDEPNGQWQRVYGLAAPQEIAGVLDALRGAGKTTVGVGR